MDKRVGIVTEEEKIEIQTLFERKNGLAELSKILTAENVELYEKLVKDMGETATKFQQWWDETAAKYGWERSEHGSWYIDFQTSEVFLSE